MTDELLYVAVTLSVEDGGAKTGNFKVASQIML
jgi:hypothetical protein